MSLKMKNYIVVNLTVAMPVESSDMSFIDALECKEGVLVQVNSTTIQELEDRHSYPDEDEFDFDDEGED